MTGPWPDGRTWPLSEADRKLATLAIELMGIDEVRTRLERRGYHRFPQIVPERVRSVVVGILDDWRRDNAPLD